MAIRHLQRTRDIAARSATKRSLPVTSLWYISGKIKGSFRSNKTSGLNFRKFLVTNETALPGKEDNLGRFPFDQKFRFAFPEISSDEFPEKETTLRRVPEFSDFS